MDLCLRAVMEANTYRRSRSTASTVRALATLSSEALPYFLPTAFLKRKPFGAPIYTQPCPPPALERRNRFMIAHTLKSSWLQGLESLAEQRHQFAASVAAEE